MTATKVRIYELAKDLGLDSSKDLIAILEDEFKLSVKSASSTIDQDIADKVAAFLKKGGKAKSSPVKPAAKTPEAPLNKAVSKSALPAKPAPRPIDEETGRPMIDPSRVRVIKRQPAPEPVAEPETPAAKVEETPRTVLDRKTPIVESKRYLIDGSAPPPAPEAPPAQPALKPGTITSPANTPIISRTITPVETQRRDLPSASAQQVIRPAPPKVPGQVVAKPGDQAAVSRPGGPPKPGEAGKKPHYQEKKNSWQEKDLSVLLNKPSKRKRQADKEYAIRQQRREEEEALLNAPKIISIAEPITLAELAKGLRLKDAELIKHLFMKGSMVTVNQTLDVDFARAIAKDFEFEVQEELDELERSTAVETQYETLDLEKKKLDVAVYKNLAHRSPVVSIMGHVDHGKTTLLDAIRETRHNIVDTEAGGITQSIGAYTVERNDHTIVFLDTPGHQAFTAMRMRGARATDIAILVVAADDGVMPQTIEAISHAKAAQIPIIVAVNKIDKADADPDRVLGQLAEHGLASEKWGGETLTVEVSALEKLGLDDLLDNILLVSELLDLKADATVPAEGVIIEAQLDKRTGPVATALIQQGTLRVGDNVLIGHVGGRVRALIDDAGKRVQEAGPAMPVEILGLNAVPNAGEGFRVVTDDKEFKQLLSAEKLREREQRMTTTRNMVTPGFAAIAGFSGVEGVAPIELPNEVQFNVIVKADTKGSAEAVVDMIRQLSTENIKVNILHHGTGDITEADVMLASTGNALMIAFNVQEDQNAEGLAQQQGITVKQYDVIYHIAEDVEKMMLGKLSPEIEEVETGRAEVRQIFKVGKTIIAGCMVQSGKLTRNARAVVLRDEKEIFTGPLNALKRFKDDVKEVASGYECGLSFEKFNDLQPGDIVVVYVTKELERTSL